MSSFTIRSGRPEIIRIGPEKSRTNVDQKMTRFGFPKFWILSGF